MSHQSIVIGYITEVYHCWRASYAMRMSNRFQVTNLPQVDQFPPFDRNAIAFSGTEATVGGYEQSIMHFGGCYKDIWQFWDEWLKKFEGFLRRIYWVEAWVRLECLCGVDSYQWSASREDIDRLIKGDDLSPISNWTFEGGPRSFE